MRILSIILFLFFTQIATAQLMIPLKTIPPMPIVYEWNDTKGNPTSLTIVDFGTNITAMIAHTSSVEYFDVYLCGAVMCFAQNGTALFFTIHFDNGNVAKVSKGSDDYTLIKGKE